MVNLSYDPFQAVGGNSGTANVPTSQSTGSQYQGTDIADNLLFPISGVTNAVTIYNAIQFASGAGLTSPGVQSGAPGGPVATTVFDVGGVAGDSGKFPLGSSGGGVSNVTCFGSGFAYGTIVAAASGAFAPAGFFFVQVPTSGNPVVKVPFFNS